MILQFTWAVFLAGPMGMPCQDAPTVESLSAERVPGMPWQRSLEDALELSRETGKPLLICVNSDGEAASEALAAGRYRDPDFIALVDGFIPVLASPSRHREREHDDFGRRLIDPKFGRLVESEHLDIEPLVYKKYFKGRRVAPRHVGVSPEGEILFDLFLLHDLGVIDDTLKQHGRFGVRDVNPDKFTLAKLMTSPDARARTRLEKIFLESTTNQRRRLVAKALSHKRTVQHPQLIQMGLRDQEERVRLAASKNVAEHPAAGLRLMLEAFRVAEGHDDLQRELLDGLNTVDLSGEQRRQRLRAERWSSLFAGLLATPDYLEPAAWSGYLEGATVELPRDEEQLTRVLVAAGETLDAGAGDFAVRVEQSRAYLEFAKLWIRDGGGNVTLMLSDARTAALAALETVTEGKTAPLARAVLASVSYLESDFASAADSAVEALPELLPHASADLTADVLDVLARVRTRSVLSAINSLRRVPIEAIQEARAAYELLLLHPAGTVEQAIAYLNFLDAIEAQSEEERVARIALRRFPGSGKIHGYYRHYVLRDAGGVGLRAAYEMLTIVPEFEADHVWFAGLAILVGAERHGEDGRTELSIADYRSSIEHFEEAVRRQPEYTETSGHYIGIARAGIARQLGESGDLEGAARALVAAAEISPGCFGAKDGRDRFPKTTARDVCRRLLRAGREAEAEALRAELVELGVSL